jgi:hypothetical protein
VVSGEYKYILGVENARDERVISRLPRHRVHVIRPVLVPLELLE